VSNIQVVLEGKGPVTLRDSNYVASGGEGKIYKISDMVVKIYHKPDEAKQRGMPDKIRLLAGLKHPYVSSPSGLVTGLWDGGATPQTAPV
jgi:DNA-binding helix-hairpin-helix protein with protein kinase domain